MEFDTVEFPYPNYREREAVTRYLEIQSYFMGSNFYNNPTNFKIRKLAVSVIARHWKGIDIDAFVPYLAMNYFDRFASRNPNSDADVRLVAICCLTIAAKMRTKSFSVDNFRANKNVVFDLETLRRTELLILNGLEWRMRPVTPFCFLDNYYPYFRRLGGFKRRDVNEIIVQAQGDNNFVQYTPSDIAMSSLLAATFVAYPVTYHTMLKPEGPSRNSRCTDDLIDFCFKKHIKVESALDPFRSEPGPSSSKTVTRPIPIPGGGGRGGREVAADESESETESQKRKRLAKGKGVVVAKPDANAWRASITLEEVEMKVVAPSSEIVPASEAEAESEIESDKQRQAVVSEIEEEEMKVVAPSSEIVPASEAEAKSETESDKQKQAGMSEIEEEEMKVVAPRSEIVPASEAEAKSETESDKQRMAGVSEIEEEVAASVPASEVEAKSETESVKQTKAGVSEIVPASEAAPISEIVPASEAAPKKLMNFDLMWPTDDPFFVGDGIPPPVPINLHLRESQVREQRDDKRCVPCCSRCNIG